MKLLAYFIDGPLQGETKPLEDPTLISFMTDAWDGKVVYYKSAFRFEEDERIYIYSLNPIWPFIRLEHKSEFYLQNTK